MMAVKFIARDALRGLLAAPLRSLISVVSLMLGAMALTILVNLNDAAKAKIDQTLQNIGPQLFSVWVFHGPSTTQPITLKSMDKLLNSNHPLNIYAYHQSQKELLIHGKEVNVSSVITTLDLLKQLNLPIIQQHRGYALNTQQSVFVGAHLAKSYDLGLGDTVWIDQKGYVVSGILANVIPNPLLDFDYNKTIFLNQSALWGENDALEYFIVVYPESLSLDKAKSLFKKLVHTYFDKSIDVYFRDESLFTDSIRQAIASTKHVFIWLVVLAMGLSVIGVMSQQWVAFIQRRGECGMRLSIGATKIELFLLFMFESMFLGGFGALLGLCLGLVGLKFVLSSLGWPYSWNIGLSLVVLLGGTTLATLSGILPAVIAARSEPTSLLTYQ